MRRLRGYRYPTAAIFQRFVRTNPPLERVGVGKNESVAAAAAHDPAHLGVLRGADQDEETVGTGVFLRDPSYLVDVRAGAVEHAEVGALLPRRFKLAEHSPVLSVSPHHDRGRLAGTRTRDHIAEPVGRNAPDTALLKRTVVAVVMYQPAERINGP